MDKDSPLYDETIAREFDDKDWICPNVTSIELKNNPTMMHTVPGVGFVMLMQACNVAKEMDKTMEDRGLTNVSYTDKECQDYDTINNNIASFQVWSKMMASNFNDPLEVD